MISTLIAVIVLLPGPFMHGVGVAAQNAPAPAAGAFAKRASLVTVRDDVSAGVIRVSGIGRPPSRLRGTRARLMARRAAEVRAVRNLAAVLGRDMPTTIRGFGYVDTSYRADGTVVVTVEYRPPTGCSQR